MRKAIIIKVGKKYGKLKVEATGFTKITNPNRKLIRHFSICECECGKRIEVDNSNLASGHSKSCGCDAGRRGIANKYDKKVKESTKQKFHFPKLMF